MPLTATCEDDPLPVMTHVETTEAAVTDGTMTAPIPQALAAKRLPPTTPMVDAGSVDATLRVDSPRHFPMALVGPVRPESSWPAQEAHADDISPCAIHWEGKHVLCP